MARTFSKNTANYLSFGLNGVNSLISGAGSLTIALWVKPASFSLADNANRFFSEYVATNTSGIVLATSNTSNFRVGVRSQNGDTFQAFNCSSTLSTGSWIHLAAVINFGSPSIVAYLNGVQDGSLTPTFGSATYNPSNAASHFLLGAFSGSGSTPADTANQVDGDIGPVGVWTTALSADQIKALAAGTRPERIRPDNLVINWTLDGEGSVECNRAGSGPKGTVTGSVPYASGPGISGPFAGNESFQYTVSTTASSGSGSVSFASSAASGSGVFASPSSGSISLSPFSQAGSGVLTASGSGAIAASQAVVSGSGNLTTTSSGSVLLLGHSVAGAAAMASTSSGSVSLASMGVAGSGASSTPSASSATGSVTLAVIGAVGVGVGSTSEYLGRFRRGDEVVIDVQLNGVPDSPPLATLYGPSGQAEASYYMPTRDGLSFSVSPLIGPWPLGTFSVSIAYSIGGVQSSLAMSFDVVPGGDSGGSVISMHVHSRPESNYVVAQLSSGVVVQGRNPHL